MLVSVSGKRVVALQVRGGCSSSGGVRRRVRGGGGIARVVCAGLRSQSLLQVVQLLIRHLYLERLQRHGGVLGCRAGQQGAPGGLLSGSHCLAVCNQSCLMHSWPRVVSPTGLAAGGPGWLHTGRQLFTTPAGNCSSTRASQPFMWNRWTVCRGVPSSSMWPGQQEALQQHSQTHRSTYCCCLRCAKSSSMWPGLQAAGGDAAQLRHTAAPLQLARPCDARTGRHSSTAAASPAVLVALPALFLNVEHRHLAAVLHQHGVADGAHPQAWHVLQQACAAQQRSGGKRRVSGEEVAAAAAAGSRQRQAAGSAPRWLCSRPSPSASIITRLVSTLRLAAHSRITQGSTGPMRRQQQLCDAAAAARAFAMQDKRLSCRHR